MEIRKDRIFTQRTEVTKQTTGLECRKTSIGDPADTLCLQLAGRLIEQLYANWS